MPKVQSLWPSLDSCLRAKLVIISGHGSFYNSNDPGAKLKLKSGVTVTLWQPLGMAMDDRTTGKWLDQGCTSTALMKLHSKSIKVVTYEGGDIVPNLILSPYGKLNIQANRAGDAHYVMPNFGHSLVTGQLIVQPDARYTMYDVESTSLFHIMEHALANDLGVNFQWAACTSTITIRKPFFCENVDVSMITVAKQLYEMTAKSPAYTSWKP